MKHMSYYAMTAAKRNGTTLEEEMNKRGYVKDYYIGSGAWHWKKSLNFCFVQKRIIYFKLKI